MHCIEPNAVGAPCQPRAVETSFSGGGSAGGRSGTGSTDASAGRSDACTTTWGEQPTPAGTGSMLLNHAGAFAASSRASFVSDAATEVGEHHPHVSHLRDAISTAPTLHSRSSTPVVLADRDTDSGRTPCTGGGPHGNRNRFAVFWTQNISVHVPGSAARDHLGVYIGSIANLRFNSIYRALHPLHNSQYPTNSYPIFYTVFALFLYFFSSYN